MKKFLCCFFIIIFYSVICLAVPPQPTDKSSFSQTVPAGSIPPMPRATNLSKPLPTNKWFNSIIYTSDANLTSQRIFLHPQCYFCDSGLRRGGTWGHDFSRGVHISYPKLQYSVRDVPAISCDGATWNKEEYPENIKVSMYNSISATDFVKFDVTTGTTIEKFNDYSATIKWAKDDTWLKAIIGQGFVFSYFETSENGYPVLEHSYTWSKADNKKEFHLYKPDGTEINNTQIGDRFILETRLGAGDTDERKVFYGIFAPEKTSFNIVINDGKIYKIFLELLSGKKYFSIGLLPSKNITEAVSDLAEYYKYAYNFVTDTKVDWKVNDDCSSQTDFKFTIDKKRTGIEEQQEGTLFCLFPHQYDNLVSQVDYLNEKTFDTLRGTLKLVKGNNFSTKVKFNGIVPFFQYDTKEIKTTLLQYLETDNNSVIVSSVSANPYKAGKIISKLANMLPVADNLNISLLKDILIIKLKALLSDWFTYLGSEEESKYFAYDNTWGGLEGIKDDEFYSYNYNDHHFHFGYFIYAAAILAMYDENFIKDYGGMVELLIKDIANTKRNDSDFPFMRHFDFYESHSWANGMGGADFSGIDQESSSEAMNAWSAIYLWGLITGNKELEKLGIYLYSNEYQAIKYYYFDIYKNILKGEYKHNSIGRLFGGCVSYDLWFPPQNPQTIKGIQVLPMTPAMTYLSYDKEYIREFYESSLGEEGSNPEQWYDIWARLVALYEPATALSNFDTYKEKEVDEGSSKSFTYHFINFFNKYGTPDFTYTADTSSYMVLEKNNIKTYCAYNPGDSSKDVHFYNSSGKDLGYLSVPAKTFSMSSKLRQGGQTEKISVYPVPYKPHSGGKYDDAAGIHFLGVNDGDNIKIFNIVGEKVFDKTVSGADNKKEFVWNARNNAGNEVASGIYFYYIETATGKIKGKLVIER